MRDLTARMSALSLDKDDALLSRLATLPMELVRRILAQYRRLYSQRLLARVALGMRVRRILARSRLVRPLRNVPLSLQNLINTGSTRYN